MKSRVFILSLVLGMFIFSISSFAVDTTWVTPTDQFKPTVSSPLSALLGVLTVVAGAVAVGMLIFIGIKYMTKGAGAKAEVKDTLLPYLIGAVLIASASGIARIALNLGGGAAPVPTYNEILEMVKNGEAQKLGYRNCNDPGCKARNPVEMWQLNDGRVVCANGHVQ